MTTATRDHRPDGPEVRRGGAVWAIVIAGGRGSRFGGAPKQFEMLGESWMVDRTVSAALRTCEHGSAATTSRSRCAPDRPLYPSDASIVVVADPAHPLAPDSLFVSVIDQVWRGANGAVPVLPTHDVIQRVRGGRVVENSAPLLAHGYRVDAVPGVQAPALQHPGRPGARPEPGGRPLPGRRRAAGTHLSDLRDPPTSEPRQKGPSS